MKSKIGKFLLILLALAISVPFPAAALMLPDAFFIEYGDFNAVSLPVLNTFYNTNDWYVDTSPGKIKDDVVLYTFPAAADENSDTLGGDNGDDAYYADNTSFNTWFSTSGTSWDPLPDGTTFIDTDYTWDVRTADLGSFLAGEDLVFFFNNNQTGDSLESNSLFFWGQVSLTPNGGTEPTLFFHFMNPYVNTEHTGDLSGTVIQPEFWEPTTNLAEVDNDPYYAFVPGLVWVNMDTGELELEIPEGRENEDWEYVKLNLGANQAAYAAWSPDLTAAVQSGAYDTMHVDFRIGGVDLTDDGLTPIGILNNGYEQLIIRPAITPVPEPATMSILGFGLLVLAGFGRKKFVK